MNSPLLQHIQYLAKNHDCVVLPGFGALIAHRVAAVVDGELFLPPGRTLAFNPAVSHNDGMLAGSVMRREGISYEAATVAVSDAVKELRELYNVAGELTLPRIGRFYRDAEGAMQFEPATDVRAIAAADFIGLPAVSLEAASTASRDESEEEEAFVPRVQRFRALRHAGRVAAAIVALLALGAVISTPVIIDRSSRQYASLAAPTVSVAHSIVVPERQGVDYQGELRLMMPDPAEATATVETPAAATERGYRMNGADRYLLIVSSHASEAEARRYIAARPAEELAIAEGDGRYRVYAASGNSAAEARSRMADSEFSSLHPDGWVLKR